MSIQKHLVLINWCLWASRLHKTLLFVDWQATLCAPSTCLYRSRSPLITGITHYGADTHRQQCPHTRGRGDRSRPRIFTLEYWDEGLRKAVAQSCGSRFHTSPAHFANTGTSFTGTSLARAFTRRLRSSVNRTTSRYSRLGSPTSETNKHCDLQFIKTANRVHSRSNTLNNK